jgi:hypothetical protein
VKESGLAGIDLSAVMGCPHYQSVVMSGETKFLLENWL